MQCLAVEQVGERLHFEQRQLRRGEHDDVDLVALAAETCEKRVDVDLLDQLYRHRRGIAHRFERRRLGGHADHVEQRHRAEARHRRAEVLELVGTGRAVDALDHRHFPVGAGARADDTAERAPVGQRSRLPGDVETFRRAAVGVEVQAVTRRAPGEPGGERRRAALEVRVGAEHAVAVDHDAGVAEGEVLAAHRRHDRLVIDAGIGHQDAERLEGVDRALLERGHLVGLAQALVVTEIDAARIGNHRHAHAALVLRAGRHAFEKFDPGLAERLGVGHDVRLRHRHEIGRVEEAPDLQHVLDRPAARSAEFAGKHRPFFVVQVHRGQSFSESVDFISSSV